MKSRVVNCPLCFSSAEKQIDADKNRTFHQCLKCELIYVPRSQLISPEKEFCRYQQHENAGEDSSYRNYLDQIQKTCAKFLTTGQRGLDFGCGASTILGDMLSQQGFPTVSYDLFFHPDEAYQLHTFDFIILSEVIEHLREPLKVMQMLKSLLRAGGKIFIKTKFYPSLPEFSGWFYKRDITHIQFFNQTSMMFLTAQIKMEFMGPIDKDLYLFKS